MALIFTWLIQHSGAVSSGVKQTVVFYKRPGREITSATAFSTQVPLLDPNAGSNAVHGISGIGHPDRQHSSHQSFLSIASSGCTFKTSPQLPTSAISIPANAQRGASRSARRKVLSVSGTTAT